MALYFAIPGGRATPTDFVTAVATVPVVLVVLGHVNPDSPVDTGSSDSTVAPHFAISGGPTVFAVCRQPLSSRGSSNAPRISIPLPAGGRRSPQTQWCACLDRPHWREHTNCTILSRLSNVVSAVAPVLALGVDVHPSRRFPPPGRSKHTGRREHGYFASERDSLKCLRRIC